MSRIYFHTEDGTAEVSGAERANMDNQIENWARGAVGLTMGYPPLARYIYEDFESFINPEGQLAEVGDYEFAEALGKALVVKGLFNRPSPFALRGKEIKLSSLVANTVLAVGSDAARLATKIHNTCEIYGYVQGFHRKWLADVIEEGLEERVFRRSYRARQDPEAHLKSILKIEMTEEQQQIVDRSFGWDEVVTLLRSSSRGPVVMSYSVCEQFPNESVGDWMPPWPEGVEKVWSALTEEQKDQRSQRAEAWHELSDAKQWAISVKGLKDRSSGHFNEPITPQNLRTWRFGHGLSLLDLQAQDFEMVARKLGVEL